MDIIPHIRKLTKSPNLRRKSKNVPLNDRALLERVLGLTVTSGAGLVASFDGLQLAFTAGCVLVLYDVKIDSQKHIINQTRKPLVCISFSPDDKYIATGESGLDPHVRIWSTIDLQLMTSLGPLHKHSINCVIWNGNGEKIISVGSQHDQMITVWNWQSSKEIASNKIASSVVDAAVFENTMVTVGSRHVKFWYIGDPSHNEKRVLRGRNALLGDVKDNYFVGVRWSSVSTVFVLAKSGKLCQIDSSQRVLIRWVDVLTSQGLCLDVGMKFVYIGGDDGIVRVFNVSTLNFVCNMPLPHSLGTDVAEKDLRSQINFKYANAVAVREHGDKKQYISVVYADRSFYTWDLTNTRHIGKKRSHLFHSSAIHGVNISKNDNGFFTVSSDGTLRSWLLDSQPSNIYSKHLAKIVHVVDGDNGIKTIALSDDYQQMAIGDKIGNIHIYDVKTWERLHFIEVHESEVLALDFVNHCGLRLLASGSRDRIIYIFHRDQNYGLIASQTDHSAAVQGVLWAKCGDSLKLISCSADRSLLFRTLNLNKETNAVDFTLDKYEAGKASFFNLKLDIRKNQVLTACNDRTVRFYSTKNGKLKKTLRVAEDGASVCRLQVNKLSCDVLAVITSEKTIELRDAQNGECHAVLSGHAEQVTDVAFLPDNKRLVSVGADAVIFIWKLPPSLSHILKIKTKKLISDRLNETFSPPQKKYSPDVSEVLAALSPKLLWKPGESSVLPGWAKRAIDGNSSTVRQTWKTDAIKSISAPIVVAENCSDDNIDNDDDDVDEDSDIDNGEINDITETDSEENISDHNLTDEDMVYLPQANIPLHFDIYLQSGTSEFYVSDDSVPPTPLTVPNSDIVFPIESLTDSIKFRDNDKPVKSPKKRRSVQRQSSYAAPTEASLSKSSYTGSTVSLNKITGQQSRSRSKIEPNLIILPAKSTSNIMDAVRAEKDGRMSKKPDSIPKSTFVDMKHDLTVDEAKEMLKRRIVQPPRGPLFATTTAHLTADSEPREGEPDDSPKNDCNIKSLSNTFNKQKDDMQVSKSIVTPLKSPASPKNFETLTSTPKSSVVSSTWRTRNGKETPSPQRQIYAITSPDSHESAENQTNISMLKSSDGDNATCTIIEKPEKSQFINFSRGSHIDNQQLINSNNNNNSFSSCKSSFNEFRENDIDSSKLSKVSSLPNNNDICTKHLDDCLEFIEKSIEFCRKNKENDEICSRLKTIWKKLTINGFSDIPLKKIYDQVDNLQKSCSELKISLSTMQNN